MSIGGREIPVGPIFTMEFLSCLRLPATTYTVLLLLVYRTRPAGPTTQRDIYTKVKRGPRNQVAAVIALLHPACRRGCEGVSDVLVRVHDAILRFTMSALRSGTGSNTDLHPSGERG